MKICRFPDARSFLDRAEAWLLRAEVENGLILGTARLLLGEHPYGDPKFLSTIESDGAIVGCAFRTPPYPFVLTRMPVEAIAPLLSDLHEVYVDLPGVHGPELEASNFARDWVALYGGTWSIKYRMRLHELREVRSPENPPAGRLRKATLEESDLANEWAECFVRDTGIEPGHAEFGRRLVREGALYFWGDDGPRSMVGVGRSTPHGAGISAVYTPPERRGRGYASAAVAAVSEELLRSGWEFCFLYTDLANPTANTIYARTGYEPRHDFVDIRFA